MDPWKSMGIDEIEAKCGKPLEDSLHLPVSLFENRRF